MKSAFYRVTIFILFVFSVSCQKDNIEFQHLILILQPDETYGNDAVINSVYPESNYGKLPDIHLYAATEGGRSYLNRVAITFDISKIPDDAKIDSAFLSLYFNSNSYYGNEHKGENGFTIRRIVSSWDENTITWNTQLVATYQNEVYVPKSSTPTQDFIDINITNLVQDIVDNRDLSYGFLLLLQEETPYKILLFASSNNSNRSLRPKLAVYYTIQK
ncbi:MAG: DNRLRE domain-containing protein [Ignavibacteriales bacterium]|nr:DNRLRE domain-containing protein [Ignavibacteriales bacterium]